MTTIEFTHHPHPLGEKAGLKPYVWRETYRFAWWGEFLAGFAHCHPVLGYIEWKVITQ